MKFRTDFVTNSSSSGFVALTVHYKDGRKSTFEAEYDSGYGGYFWNGGDFESAFDLCKTGEDLLEAVISQTEGKEFLEHTLDSRPEFKKELVGLKSVEEISRIEMEENTFFDDGGKENWKLKYKFEHTKMLPFVKPEELKITCNNNCILFGDFQYENKNGDYSEIIGLLKRNNWNPVLIYEGINGRDQKEYQDYMRKKRASWYYPIARILVVGDISARELKEGKYGNLIRSIKRMQKEDGFVLIRESEFLRLGKYQLQWDDCPIDSLKDKRVAVVGEFDTDDICGYIHDCGGINLPSGDISNCNYIIVGNKNAPYVTNGHFGCFSARSIRNTEIKDSTKVMTEKTFLEKTVALKESMEQTPVQPITCKGQRFMLTGRAAMGKKLKNYITSRGGILVDGSPTAAKKINYVLFMEFNTKVGKAEALRAKGNDISIMKVEDFYKATEQDDPTDEIRDVTEAVPEVHEEKGILNGYVCCLTGDFSYGSKGDVEKYIVQNGGACTSSVTKKTNMLIIGAKGSEAYSYGSYGNKYIKAKEMQKNGADMTILQEKEFFERFNINS